MFDEGLAALASSGAGGAMYAVQQLRGGDGGDGHGLAPVGGESGLQVHLPTLRGDQDRGVDQRPHGDLGARPWRPTARRTSEAYP